MCIVAEKKFHKYLDTHLYNMQQIELIGDAIQAGFTEEEIEIVANPAFHWEQMWEVIRGFKTGLPIAQVRQYAKTCYNPRQMYQIYLAMSAGCSQTKLNILLDSRFDAGQMSVIRLGFLSGLSVQDVKRFADPILSASDMQSYRIQLEHNKYIN